MNRKIWIGLVLVALSYTELLIPKDWAMINHFAAGFPYSGAVALFVFGVIFLGEGLAERFGAVPLLSLARGGFWRVLRFAVIGAATGLILEIFGQWIGKLWFYAYYPTWFYWPSLVPSFLLYWVMIVESYIGAKAVLDHFIKRGGKESADQPVSHYPFEPALYGTLGVVGGFVFIFCTIRALTSYFFNGGYAFNALTQSSYGPPLVYIMLACVGLWAVAEALLYAAQKPSLLRSLLHGYFVPVLAVLVAAVVTSVVWESQNAMVDYWVYTHWPWPDLRLFNVQLSVLLSWPLHYLVLVSLPAAIVPAWANAFFARPHLAANGRPKKTKHHD